MDSYTRLRNLLQITDNLTQTSTREEIDTVGRFFRDDCVGYMKSMREYDEPSRGRDAVLDAIAENLKVYHTRRREILSHATTDSGATVLCETKTSLHVLGDILDPFYETLVVSFDEAGLITEFKQYSCRSHIVEIVQAKTGAGPYSSVPQTKGQPAEEASCCG